MTGDYTADPYAPIAGIYDFSYLDFTEDIEFYANLAQAVEGPLLELGAGSGRVTIPLAQLGYQVTGIDTSPSMLEAARQTLAGTKLPRKGKCELLTGDMTNFDLGRKFGLVFVAANTFQHLLTMKQQQECLRCAAAHLAPGGVFAMSVRSPASVGWDDAGGPAPLLLDWTRLDEETGEVVMKYVAAHPDPANMVRRLTYVYDRVSRDGTVKRHVFVTDLKHSGQAELTLLLQQAGLRVTHVYGDYDLSPVGQGDQLIFVARAEASR